MAETNELNEDVLIVSIIECRIVCMDGISTISHITNLIKRDIFITLANRNMVKKASFVMVQLISMAMRTNIDLSDVDDFLPDLFNELDKITIIMM